MLKIIRSIKHSYPMWRYFFLDLPFWAIGWRTQERWLRMQSTLKNDAFAFKKSLQAFYANTNDVIDIDHAVDKALRIRAIRNSDAYACLSMNKKNLDKNFSISGFEHLHNALGLNRPIILLTAHTGSFYTIAIALGQLGIHIDPVARTVDNSQYNPLPQQYFEHSNYFLTQTKMQGRYVFTNNANKIDRHIISACKNNGILLVLPDIPRKFIPTSRFPVQLLGKKASLPTRIIDLGIKYNALFLTVWSTIELRPDYSFKRHLRIDPGISTADKKTILQNYADRLSSIVRREPWQWMGTAIINQYDEETA
ncbi:hypothetical protein [Nitrosomonas aestuarii]|uniref:LpxL/LpxP family acyltransferase n=1 Tax=Nitrosomonas aestuarii TaxID=52441 RepID=UPI000D2F84A0|nr:hypothetical protein [Nitrosomonas aestuarii]PTN12107.1 lipid A biosynthesis acyltransferase [Nitrosomonas aestuarii]